jgi:uncharacterized protein (TIGR02588 family)
MAQRAKPQRYPLVEWLSAALGLVIIAAMLGFLVLEAARQRERLPPSMNVVPVGLVSNPGRYLVEVEVTNAAHKTGASVQIEGVLKEGETDVETSSATLAYVPGESRRRAGLLFTRDPRSYQLELRVTGYELP